jgi:PAS domain S-box-containing protein
MGRNIQELTKSLRETEELLRQEIDRRKAVEKTLKISRETFKLALKEMPVIIFASDEDGSLIFFNREFARVTGYNALDLAEDPEILQSIFNNKEKSLQGELEVRGESSFRSQDGLEKVVFWSNISEYFLIPGWKSWKVGVDITELKATQTKVKILSGLLSICANCKKVRDDKGYWNQIEAYIQDHSEAEFSHGICPICAKKLYPDLYKDNK